MYLLGHIGLAVLIYIGVEYFFDKTEEWLTVRNTFLVGLGSMLPDFLDKPVGSLVFNSGRWLGHALLFQIIILSMLQGIGTIKTTYPRYRRDVLVLFLGANIHLLGDLPGINTVTVFWPFFGPFETGPKNSFLFGFTDFETVVKEITGFFILITTGYYQNWERREWLILFTIITMYFSLFLLIYLLLV